MNEENKNALLTAAALVILVMTILCAVANAAGVPCWIT